ncbi:MAG: hypothetical protein ACK5HD_09570 [Bacteroidota bacterium]|jgi:hypothetical protein
MKFNDIAVSSLSGFSFQGLFHETWLMGNSKNGEWRVLQIEEDGGQLVAAFLVWSTNSWWGKQVITPPLMPTIGIYTENTVSKRSGQNTKRKEVLQCLISGLRESNYAYWKLDFPPDWNDFQPFIWEGIQPAMKYTYRIDLKSTWREQISGKLKNVLTRKESYVFTNGLFTPEQWRSFNLGLNQYGITGGSGFEEMIGSNNATPFYCIAEEKGRYLAVCGLFDGVMYYFAAVNEKKDNALSACGLMHCIELAESLDARSFDFEGSMMPNVERFFRGFGGQLINYGSVSDGKWWVKQMKKIKK